jgi:hypothetical protein
VRSASHSAGSHMEPSCATCEGGFFLSMNLGCTKEKN